MKGWEKALCTFGAVLCVLVLLSTIAKGGGGTDLWIFLDAAEHLRHGETVYDLSVPNEHTKPPLATLLFVPLTRVPRAVLQSLWTAAILVVFLGLARFLVRSEFRAPPGEAEPKAPHAATWLILALMTTLNPWNKEVRLSQYNVLSLACLMYAGLGRRSGVGGTLAAIAVLLKPTNVLFLPWVLRQARSRAKMIAGAAMAVAVLAAIYAALYGWSALIADHRTWLQFLPRSSAKHLHREDNFGLVRAIDDCGFGRLMPLVWAAGGAAVLAAVWRTRGWLPGLSVSALACILLTPMGWFQNFTLALPYAVYLLARVFRASRARAGFALALAALYWGLEVHPALCGASRLIGPACSWPVPLWGVLASCAACGLALVESSRVG